MGRLLTERQARKVQRLRNDAAAGGLAVQVELGDLETTVEIKESETKRAKRHESETKCARRRESETGESQQVDQVD